MSAKPKLTTTKLTTTVSTKGQVILPKAIRDQRRWPAGTELWRASRRARTLFTAKAAFGVTCD